jgi:hypothetical protein
MLERLSVSAEIGTPGDSLTKRSASEMKRSASLVKRGGAQLYEPQKNVLAVSNFCAPLIFFTIFFRNQKKTHTFATESTHEIQTKHF